MKNQVKKPIIPLMLLMIAIAISSCEEDEEITDYAFYWSSTTHANTSNT